MKSSFKTLIPVQLAAVALVGVAGASTANAASHRTSVTMPTNQAPIAATSKCKTPQPKKDLHLTRAQIVARGMTWIGKVSYSQIKWHCDSKGYYRQDCSGFVSMAWGLHSNTEWTKTLIAKKYSSPIKNWKKYIKQGDAITRLPKSQAHGHVALVQKRTSKGVWVLQENQTGTKANRDFKSWKELADGGYYGIRYKNVK
ncbi:hypothetical protein NE236_41845 [Actinoallomurus purpureus]|uniref:hypothetical protein n=1 Tax=Actinoallomurus purpureus TaxID=478114 RepID=UPI002092E100|nr:hypothetical protein [Actinoallomurus purpureus]MCO6011514.1 hypothetical protein [Actinoallomurus purpureus]